MPRLNRGVNSDYTIRTYNNRDAKVDVVAHDRRLINSKAIQLDDSGTEVLVSSDDDSLSFTDGTNDQPLTISMWLKQTDATGTQYPIAKGAGSSPLEYLINVVSGQLRFYIYTDTSNYYYVRTAGSIFTVDSWNHLVATYDGNKSSPAMKIYLNGVAIDTTRVQVGTYAGMANSNKDLTIGAGNSSGGANFIGQIADTCIFRTDLSGIEVSELYNGGKVIDLPHYSRWADTVSWWKMGDDLDSSSGSGALKDYVGTNHATPSGITIESTLGVLGTDTIGGFQAPLPFILGVAGRPSLRHAPQDS